MDLRPAGPQRRDSAPDAIMTIPGSFEPAARPAGFIGPDLLAREVLDVDHRDGREADYLCGFDPAQRGPTSKSVGGQTVHQSTSRVSL
jgi:hypothetical protein